MVSQDEDDLFQHTSMTFGEHLEELRAALFKAVIALVVGFAIGLLFAAPIVRAIERPLRLSLEDYYQREAIDYLNARVPPELRDDAAIQALVFEQGLLPEERFISPRAIASELKQWYPEQFKSLELPPRPSDKTTADKPAEARPADDKPAGEPRADEKPASAGEETATKSAPSEYRKEEMLRLFLWRPMADDERLKLDSLSVQEPFVIYIKAGFLAGAVISSPAVFYFLWQFVAAGLYPHEKRYVHLFLPFSLALFFAGAGLAFFFVFPPVLNFFFGIAESLGTQMRPRLNEWLSFVLLLPLGFGISFQLPLVMLFLERINVFNVTMYLAKWRLAVLIIAIVAMVLSPGGDPYSMLFMLVPLVGLYFLGVALCQWLPNPRKPKTPVGK